jgi:ParB family chromosome partitioning protein
MAKKLLEKAGLINLPPRADKPAPAPVPGEVDAAKAKTAPGSMLQFMTVQSAAIQEAETLRERLAAFDGALPTRRLDAAAIQPSRWANRHELSMAGPDFDALKQDIQAAGGNVQPIKVRPVGPVERGVGPSNPPGSAAYEIVYGHRRHRACLELGLPVLAAIEPVSEQQLFVEMERENRARKDLSAWEQGCMYARALDAGLYPSNRQLAMAIGRDLGDVGKAITLARLPQVVVDVFQSPMDLQFRWAKPLADLQQRDPDALVVRAKALREQRNGLSPKELFGRLVNPPQGVGPSNPPEAPAEIAVRAGHQSAVVGTDAKGRTVVRFDVALDEAKRQALVSLVERFLSAD